MSYLDDDELALLLPGDFQSEKKAHEKVVTAVYIAENICVKLLSFVKKNCFFENGVLTVLLSTYRTRRRIKTRRKSVVP